MRGNLIMLAREVARAEAEDAQGLGDPRVIEHPFSPFMEITTRPIVDSATGWRQAREAVAAMMASA
jgi:hypothetical protein